MKQDAKIDLYERTVAALSGKRPEGAATSATVPTHRYTEQRQYDEEAELFRRFAQPIAASGELAAPGSWLARDRFGTPFLLVRQESGAVHAFLNVCRHRGARLVEEGAGEKARAFSCPYHAWTYRTDGTLRGVPESFGFPCLNQSTSGLRRLAASERAGLIWVVPDPDLAEMDVDASLGPLMDELEAMCPKSSFPFEPRSYSVDANWKLLVDGSFEAYHFKIAHRQTIAHMFTQNCQIVDESGLNRRLYLVKSTFEGADRPSLQEFEPREHGNVLYFFFPNTMILVQPDHAQFSSLELLSPGQTRVHEITLLPKAPDTAKAEGYWRSNVELYRRTLAEDYALSESIQAGFRSKANEHLTFATFEFSAPRFHAQLKDELKGTGSADLTRSQIENGTSFSRLSTFTNADSTSTTASTCTSAPKARRQGQEPSQDQA